MEVESDHYVYCDTYRDWAVLVNMFLLYVFT